MNRARSRRTLGIGTVVSAVLTSAVGIVTAGVLATAPATSAAGPQAGRQIEQQAVSYADGSPIGAMGFFWRTSGGARFGGWDFDPTAPTTALQTYATVDGKRTPATLSNLTSSAALKAYPGAGAAHGFDITVPVAEGSHTVCVFARNIGKGTDLRLYCTTRTYTYGPFGSIDSLTAANGSVHVRGWDMDGDSPATSITTGVVIDGVKHTFVANKSRPDVAHERANAGPLHGFDVTYPLAQGTHTICVVTTNVGLGENTTLGCRTLTLNESPHHVLATFVQKGYTLHIAGWAFDPDQPTTALKLAVHVDSAPVRTIVANLARSDVAAAAPSAGKYHGFDQTLTFAAGTHHVCIVALNLSYGSDQNVVCRSVTVNVTPTASLTALSATSTGLTLSGWTSDPDTTEPISARITVDGRTAATVTANGSGPTHSGHNFSATLASTSGKHTVCAIGLNVLYGSANSAASCRTITLVLRPIGRFETLTRAGSAGTLAVTGWALDPDTTSPLTVAVTLDGKADGTVVARTTRSDIGKLYPASGAAHGISSTLTATAGEHTVCLVAKNVGAGTDTSLGCREINAVHPVVPSVPRAVTGVAGYGAVTVAWTAPASDGGAPWSSFVVTTSPGGATVSVAGTARSVVVSGLKVTTKYSFTVRAVNVAGSSAASAAVSVTTKAGPPPQTTPAPVSTSRYIRNIRGSSAAELATMRKEGATDATNNPSGHSYLILLDIGGQDAYDGGVVLSATTRFVTYGDLVRDLQAYADGYHSTQRSTAPVVIAIGTNNDMDVSAASGAAWATKVVNPLASYAAKYANMTIAGADDIEPGFRASYAQTKAWLTGYLGATSRRFIFNGSADGCAWTVTNRSCNNGWTMAGLYNLAGGAAPTRSQNLPQVYNSTMAAQWKYISLTGIGLGQPRLNFGGPLTEWTACDQSSGCGSLTGHTAWQQMWNDLQSDARLRVSSLPYSTDLRIDS